MRGGRNLEQLLVTAALIAANTGCVPPLPESRPDDPTRLPMPSASETLESGILTVAPQETLRTPFFTFTNAMNGYAVQIDTVRLAEVITHYGIPVKPSDKTTVRLLEDIFQGGESAGVDIRIRDDGAQELYISGGLFIYMVTSLTGRPPSDLRDMTFLSEALSVKLVGGMALLAQESGGLASGQASEIEHQYELDIRNLNQRFVAGMQNLEEPAYPVPEFSG